MNEVTVMPKKETPSFCWKVIYDAYPARNGTHRITAAFGWLKKTVKTQATFDMILLAAKNYQRHCDAEKTTGTEYVLSFNTFVRGDYLDWVNSEPRVTSLSSQPGWDIL